MSHVFRTPLVLAACAALVMCAPVAFGQEPSPQPNSANPPAAAAQPADVVLEIDTDTDKDEAKPLREQTIYIPYAKLKKTFEKEGRGVFLPYEKFQELWKQARSKHAPDVEVRPPVGALLTDIENDATVEKEVVQVRAKLQIEILGKGWQKVPLRLKDAAIRSAVIGGKPARIVFDEKTGYQLLVENPTEEPIRLELVMEYAKTYSKAPGQNSVSFQAPQAPVNRWRIRIPQAGVKVNIHPMIAATEIEPPAAVSAPPAAAPKPPAEETPAATPAEGGDAPAEKPKPEAKPAPKPAPKPKPKPAPPAETVIMAFVGVAPEVRVDWTPKAEGAAGLKALASVQAEQEVSIEEGVIRTRTRLAYEISRAELLQLTVDVPSDQKVTGVFDPNVRQWEVAEGEAWQSIRIQLFEPASGSQNITVEMERFADMVTMRELPIPVVRAANVGRQQGVVVVKLGEELKAQSIRRNGLLQVDKNELPPTLQRSQWMFAHRYATLPFELVLGVEKVQPQIRTDELVEVYVEPERLTYDLLALFDIQKAGVFQLEMQVPAGFQVIHVRGVAAAGAEAAHYDTHHLEGEEKTRLKVNLSRKAIHRVGLSVRLQKSLSDPNLLTPTGEASEIPFSLPRVLSQVEHVSGRVIVYAPSSLLVNPRQTSGLRNISFAEALQGVQSLRGDQFTGLREVLAYAYTEAPLELTAAIQRRKPYVTARQLLTARIESGVVKYDANFFFDVQYSEVKSLRIDVPQDLVRDLQLEENSPFRKDAMDPPPADVPEGYVAWSFTGKAELLGSAVVHLTWEQTRQELEVGKSADYVLPALKPMDVDRAWGQIVVTKAETLDVHPQSGFEGLRPIDPQLDLMDGTQIADAARAFEFHDDWKLTLTATRYELEDVKRTSIERAVLRMVVTRSNRVAVQALYRMRSAVQRLAVHVPEGAEFDTDPLRLNGKAIALERGDKDELYIPLVGQSPDQAFVLELRYTIEGDYRRLDFPDFPSQPPVQSKPAVQKVVLCAYLPEDMALLGFEGPWTPVAGNWFDQRVRGQRREGSDSLRVDWVTENIELHNDPRASFPTDGDLYTFTTLQPEPPPDGSLRLIAVKAWQLSTFVFAALAVVGVLCIRSSAATKLAVLTLLIIALVLVGVFWPMFALRVIDARFFAALFLLLLVWLVSTACFRRSAAAATTAPTPPPVPSPFGGGGESALPSTPVEPAAEPAPADEERPMDAEAVEPRQEDDDADDENKGGPDDV
ncbi:MAG: hypothetical protein ACC628_16865 [Pirellulaceae bacterium]